MSDKNETNAFTETLDLLEAELYGQARAVRTTSIAELRDLCTAAQGVSQARANIAAASVRNALEKEIPTFMAAFMATVGGYKAATVATAPASTSTSKRKMSVQNIERWRELVGAIVSNGQQGTLVLLRAFVVSPGEVDWNALMARLETDLGGNAAREFMELTTRAWVDAAHTGS